MGDDGSERCVAKVSLQDLCDEEGTEISLSKLDHFLNSVIDLSAEKHEIRPDRLIKVIYAGELIVLTQEQADHLLQSPHFSGKELSDLRKAVERALKGDMVWIRQELMVMIMMARMTMDRFRHNPNIDEMEILRLYPFLERTEKEANQILDEIQAMNDRVEKVRSQHPLINEYETKVGQMVAMQQAADLSGAKRIALELQSKKKHYLFCCRSIEPEIRGIQFRRLDLQKIKKRLLNIHKYLTAQKIDDLQIEVSSIQKKIRAFQSEPTEKEMVEAHEPNGMMTDYFRDLENMIQLLEDKSDEIQNLSSQNQVFDHEEKQTGQVIQEITTEIIKSSPTDVSDQVAELDARRKMKKEIPKPEGPKSARMVTLQRKMDETP